MKTTIKAFVYVADFGSCNGKTYVIFNDDRMEDGFYKFVGPVNIEYEVPATPQIQALELTA